jgi:hypothetical protein
MCVYMPVFAAGKHQPAEPVPDFPVIHNHPKAILSHTLQLPPRASWH